MSPRQAIIIGASSGIGEALAGILSRNGYHLGLTARRRERLESIQSRLPTTSEIREMDITDLVSARRILRELIDTMGNVELIVINAGVSAMHNPEWEKEQEIIATNVAGFVATATITMDHFRTRGGGHLVGISSIAGLAGFGRAAAYSASKAFVSTYMQGLRQRAVRTGQNITVTDIKPGYVQTAMTEGRSGLFWNAPLDKAAEQIAAAIRDRRSHAYITRRWRLVGWVLKLVPDWLFVRLPL